MLKNTLHETGWICLDIMIDLLYGTQSYSLEMMDS